jgi:hypothetical protein
MTAARCNFRRSNLLADAVLIELYISSALGNSLQGVYFGRLDLNYARDSQCPGQRTTVAAAEERRLTRGECVPLLEHHET